MTETPYSSRESVTVSTILNEISEVSLRHKKKSTAECERALEELCNDIAGFIITSTKHKGQTHVKRN